MLESFLIWLLLIWKSHIQAWSLPCVMVHRSIEICHPPSARWCLTKNGGFTLLHCIISRQYTIMKPLECLHFAFPGPKSESISSGATWKWQVDSFAMMGPYQTWLGCGDGWTNIQTPMSGKMWDGLGWFGMVWDAVFCIFHIFHMHYLQWWQTAVSQLNGRRGSHILIPQHLCRSSSLLATTHKSRTEDKPRLWTWPSFEYGKPQR